MLPPSVSQDSRHERDSKGGDGLMGMCEVDGHKEGKVAGHQSLEGFATG